MRGRGGRKDWGREGGEGDEEEEKESERGEWNLSNDPDQYHCQLLFQIIIIFNILHFIIKFDSLDLPKMTGQS